MLTEDVAAKVIEAGLGRGAGFVDLFVERTEQQTITMLDSQVKGVSSGIDFGVGVRLIFGTQAYYGYSNNTTADDLIGIVNALADFANAGAASKGVSLPKFNRTPLPQGSPQFVGSLAERVELLSRYDKEGRRHNLIAQVDLSLSEKRQTVQIFDSDGTAACEVRPYIILYATSIAKDGQEQARGRESVGASAGWDHLIKLPHDEIAVRSRERALKALRAGPCPKGRMPVIIDKGFGGVIFHEACGHLLETTSVEKKASVFHDKMGTMIANPAVSAIDDGTIPTAWGSLAIDDEGMQTKRTQLIKEGRLVSFLADRLGSMKTGFERTGSGRRQSYKFAPASRMRNTFIEPGSYSLDQLIGSVENGLYAKVMGGGSVSPGTGQFNFAVEDAFLIKGGKIAEQVKGATLIGTGPEVLQKISMVGSDFALAPGMCGSVSGSIPVTVGQPALKVDDILVGGQ